MPYPDDKETFRRVVNQDLPDIDGDVVDKDDQNLPADFLERLQDTLGYSIKMGYASVKAFFDWIVTEVGAIAGKVSKSGDTMTGDLTFNTDKYIVMKGGIDPYGMDEIKINFPDVSATTKISINNKRVWFMGFNGVNIYSYLNLSADMSMGNNHLYNIRTPETNGEGANKGYVDDQDDLKVTKAGDTMTGDLEFPTATDGIILKDRTTATRYRLKIDNGVFGIEAI